MSIQQVSGGDSGGKLALQWTDLDPTTTQRISVQIAKDGLFTQDYHHFLLPSLDGVKGASFAVSQGPWFFRVGIWKKTTSEVDWSGIFGPVLIQTQRQMKSAEPSKIKVLHTQSIENGLRIHTGTNTDSYFLVEISTADTFTIANSKYRFIHDAMCSGQIDIMGLQPYKTYAIRFAEIKNPQNSIEEPTEWIVLKGKKSLQTKKPINTADHAVHKAERLLLQEAKTRPMRFSSGADYANYLAAQAKAKGALQRE